MRKLLVMLGLVTLVVSANASNNPEFAKKCKSKVKHGQVRMKGNCDRPASTSTTDIQNQPDGNY